MNPLALISAALRYPGDELAAARDDLARAARALPASPARDALTAFLDWWAAEPADALRRRYVETFDLSRRTGLDLTYYTHGDRRQRGLALLALRRRYDAAGLELQGPELPDHLPVVLEFAALEPGAGGELLADVRPLVELIRLALERAESPWAGLLGALCLLLPPPTETDLAELRRLAREGPPGEAVGLEPFAPPEVMPEPLRPCGGAVPGGAR
ncbi:nitrate reductase molybdenum cofactor assembly chaperone [Miltoncostaea marina]|uniref:nitrate reductase molybdenum cofactor assembly chaperone n=1 Tax=Miltoncostaea marina TaxID=2843215 RepID=UPI001C3DB371|nr:nitrate reductase molybdenum cofactor assembly chaperone [Miltoncostaea marina]